MAQMPDSATCAGPARFQRWKRSRELAGSLAVLDLFCFGLVFIFLLLSITWTHTGKTGQWKGVTDPSWPEGLPEAL